MSYTNTPNTQVQLNDGKSVIASWSHDFNQLPTIGEVVHISSIGGNVPDGYQSHAKVFRMDRNLSTGEVTVILDLVPVDEKEGRPVVILNTEYVPENLRRDVEEHLRGALDVPAFEWIQSTDPAPIISIHAPGNFSETNLAKLQAGVRQIIDEASPLATI